MIYLATVRKTPSGYNLLWSPKVGPGSGPGLSRFFVAFAELTSYLLGRTDFSESYESTLREKLETEGTHMMELNPSCEEEDEWRAQTSVKVRVS